MRRYTIASISLAVWTMQSLMTTVECSNWAWERERDYYTPVHRRSHVPHVGVRRSIFDRFWGDTTPNNPFLPTSPSASHLLPRLSDNDFLTRDDDYDEYLGDPHWYPQRLPHSTHRSPPLEELQHKLEELIETMDDPSETSHHQSPAPAAHVDEKKKPKSKQRKHQQHYKQGSSPSSPSSSPSSSSSSSGMSGTQIETSEGTGQLPDYSSGTFTHDRSLGTDDHHFSKDIDADFSDRLSMPSHFTNSKQFPPNSINLEDMPRDFRQESSLPNEHLTTDPFASVPEGHEPFQEHIILSPGDFQSPDLSEIDFPKIFSNLGFLGKFDQPGDFINQDHLGHFDVSGVQSPDLLPESGGEGPGWLPSLNLPSHGEMMSAVDQQTKEAQRGTRIIRSSMSLADACHARNLHSCGSRLIDEFEAGPNNSEKCRIREEFLDCMEKVMKRPCELTGEQYNRKDTKRIRDRIKTLLWSAQGCILGYST